jgi:3-oxoacyl-[acyl-carrier protein] reductase
MALKDNIAVVTGAGRGIGKAIALSLAREGVDVALCSRTKSEVDAVAREIEKMGRRSLAVQADVSQEKDVENVISETIKKFGRIDVLINNAGIGYFANVKDLSVNEFDQMWAINMRGVFLITRAVIPTMIQQQSGDIVNIASLAGRNAFVGGAGYSATKWALIGFSRTLMLEVRQHNIRVITICPGSVNTTFGLPELRTSSSDWMPTADDVAQVVVNALKMPRHVMLSEIDMRPTYPQK